MFIDLRFLVVIVFLFNSTGAAVCWEECRSHHLCSECYSTCISSLNNMMCKVLFVVLYSIEDISI